MQLFYKNVRPKLLMLLALFFCGISTIFAQSSNYSFAQSTGTYTPITGTTSTASGDDGVQDGLNIGFTFNFAGSPYTTFSVSTNGYVKLGGAITTGTNNYNNNNFFGSTNGTNVNLPMFAIFFDDNNLGSGNIQYTTTGTTGNHILTVQWTNCNMGGAGSTTTPTSSFQINFIESNSTIQYVYGTTSAALTNSTASIGISSGATNYLAVTPGTTATASNSVLSNSISSFIPANTVYTFTPPPACTGAPVPGNTIASATAVCSGVGFTLSLQNNPAVSGLSYLWETSANGTSFSPATGTNTGATYSATQTAATYYRATVTCATGPTSPPSTPVQVTMSPFSSCYCTPTSSCVNEGIENVTMGTLNHSSTFCTNSTGYSDFTGLGSLESASQGAAVPISVSAHINSNPAFAGVWIDYDHNGIFDTSEYQSLGSAAVTIPSGGVSYTFTGTININVAALTGITRMRVRSANQSGITNSSACTNGGIYGEYEDYLITITAGTACTGTPTGGTAATNNANVCSNGSATLSATGYTAGVTGVIYQWQVSTNNGSTYTNIGAGTLNYADYTLTNITQTAMYRLSVLCGPTSTTGYGTPVTITVPGPLALPVDEGFNTASSSTFPGCWNQQFVTGTSSLSFPASSSNPATTPEEGTGYVFWNSYSIFSGTTRLVSPAIATTGTSSVDVNFYWMNENSVNYNSGNYLNEGVQVQYSFDGTTWTDAGAFIPRYDATLASGVNQWKQKFITLPAAAGNVPVLYVGFKFVSADGDNCSMDAVHIGATPACQVPTNLATGTISSTTAALTWTASTSAPANGYQYYVSTSGTAPTSATTPTGSVAAGVTTATATALAPATTYNAWVRSQCSSSTYSSWTTFPLTFTTACSSAPIPLNEGFNTASNSTFPSCWSQQFVTGAHNLTFETAITNPTATPYEGTRSVYWNAFNINGGATRLVSAPLSTTGTPSVDVNFYWMNDNTDYTDPADGYYDEGVQVQYSLDGNTWVDAGPFIARPDSTSPPSVVTWNLKTVTLPSAAGNQALVYVGFKFVSQYGDNCAMDAVNIAATPACQVPTIGTTTNVTATTATLHWTAPANAPANGYQYYYSTTNTAPVATTTPSGSVAAGITTAVISPLTPETTYYAWVRSACGTSSTSTWTAATTFTTLPACQVPTGLTVSNVTAATATISWTAPAALPASGYEYYTSTTNTAPTSTTTPTGTTAAGITTKNLTALTANTTYYVWVRSACSATSHSTWSSSNSFTTMCNPTAIPLSEGFNTASSGTLPSCWTQQYVTGNSDLSFETAITDPSATPYEGTRNVFWNAYNINNDDATRLVSAPLSSTGIASVDVKFYWLNDNTNYIDPSDGYYGEGVQVQYSLDGQTWVDAGAFISRPDSTQPAAAATWNQKTVTLPAAAGNQALLFVGFKFVSQYGDNCALDAVNIAGSCPIVNLGPDVIACNTASYSDTLNAGNAGATYLWDNATTSQTRVINTAGNYYVAVTQNGCTKTDSVNVTLNAIPIVNLGNDTAICSGTSFTMDAGNAGSTYVWDDTTTTETRSVNAAGTYFVDVTNASNCSASDTIHVTIVPMPSASITATSSTPGVYAFSFTNPVNVVNAAWTFGDNSTGSGLSLNHTYAANGVYNVTAYLVGLCGDTVIATKSITVAGVTGVNTVNIASDLLILYPNPANDVLNIENKSNYPMQYITLYNVIGQLVYSSVADSKNNHKVALTKLASGMYTLKIETDKGFVVRKFEVIK